MQSPAQIEAANQEYLDGLIAFLPTATFKQAINAYDAVVNDPNLDPMVEAGLAKHDRYFLLTWVLRLGSAIKRIYHPWIYERCRQVEAEPDHCLDLWSREHFKSTIITFGGGFQEIIKSAGEITIGIFSHNSKHSRDRFVVRFKTEMENNPNLYRLWPDIFYLNPKKESPIWSRDTGLVVKRKANPPEPTISGWGLVDGQPTGSHFGLIIYDDVVTEKSVTTPEMIIKTTDMWELSTFMTQDQADGELPRIQYIGTRYCLVAATWILMEDFSCKPIGTIEKGDVVIGWELKNGKRWLVKSKVLNVGHIENADVFEYAFESGESVWATADHKWWRGAHGSGDEYKKIGLKYHEMSAVRRLMVPQEGDAFTGLWYDSYDAGWLAGFYDADGTFRKNPNHPSGAIVFTQTENHPELLQKLRRTLKDLHFDYSERIVETQEKWSTRHDISIRGGWRARYRFLREIKPAKNKKIIESLFGQLITEEDKLESIEPAGKDTVYWIETETGNYIADGLCSKNSYADTYQVMLDRKVAKPRIFPATDDGTADGKPVFLTENQWEDKKRKTSTYNLACQMLQNPMAGGQREFELEWIRYYEVRPEVLNIYLTVDPASSKKKGSSYTAMAVQGVDHALNKYLLDGAYHKMNLTERWKMLKRIYFKWLRQPGVQVVKVGYEKYGLQADIEHFKEMMKIEKCPFPINEVSWPRERELGAKDDRIRRLIPDHANWRYFYPYAGKEQTSLQAKAIGAGKAYLVAKKIIRKNEDGRPYDVFDKMYRNEYLFFPNMTVKDFQDAQSRIYDLDPSAPQIINERDLYPDWMRDG